MEQYQNVDVKMSLSAKKSIVIGVEAGKPFEICLGKNDFPEGTIIKVRITIEDEPEEITTDIGESIPGHPDCKVGECLECHNVACAIHQGFEEMP